MNNEFYEEFSKLSEKDRKEVLDLMQYKIHIDNKNFKNRVEHLENIIDGLESDVRVLGEHIEDDCTAHEEAIKWCIEAQKLSIRINKAIDIIEKYNLGKYDYSIPTIGIIELLEILKGEENE